jgi:hypothetical protein
MAMPDFFLNSSNISMVSITGSKRGALPFDVPMLITLTDPQVQRG